MNISISKLNRVVDDLQQAELSYKRQVDAFETVYHKYQSLASDGKDKQAMKLVLEDMRQEYHAIKKLKQVLTEIIKTYESTEKSIVGSSNTISKSKVRKIDIREVREILDQFHIILK